MFTTCRHCTHCFTGTPHSKSSRQALLLFLFDRNWGSRWFWCCPVYSPKAESWDLNLGTLISATCALHIYTMYCCLSKELFIFLLFLHENDGTDFLFNRICMLNCFTMSMWLAFFSQQMIFLHSFDIFRCEYRTQMYLPDRNSVVEKMPRKTQIIQKYLTIIFEWCSSGLFLHICSIFPSFYNEKHYRMLKCQFFAGFRSQVSLLLTKRLSGWLISEFVTLFFLNYTHHHCSKRLVVLHHLPRWWHKTFLTLLLLQPRTITNNSSQTKYHWENPRT